MIKDLDNCLIKPKDNQCVIITITDESYIGAARRQAIAFADKKGFSQTEIDKIVIIVNELGSNLIKHANKNRRLLFQSFLKENKKIFEVIAIDAGPGLTNITQCLQDGYSATNTAGNGLGAVSRLADFFNVYSLPGKGTIVLAQIHINATSQQLSNFLDITGICVPIIGEEISGDSWSFYQTVDRSLILVADGLGHGPGAAEASQLACKVFQNNVHLPPKQIIHLINSFLRKTRGAVIAVAEIDKKQQQVKFAGLGNISGGVCIDKKIHHMVSRDGTAGVGQYAIQEYIYPWHEKALLVMHSDGLISRWTIDQYAGLYARDPAITAGLLYRDFCRGTDDITIVVARQRSIISNDKE